MRTSRAKASISLFLAAIAVSALATNCLPSDECLRFSDCNEGFTCAFGKCVVPPAQSGDEGGITGEGGTTSPDGAVTFDSGTPSDSGSIDGSDDSGDASDAGSADAADD